MTPVETMRGQSVALFGLGGSGLSTARALVDGGAEVAAWDDSPVARERASAAGIALVDLAKADWRAFKLFVLAPGVPLTHPAPHWTVNLADEAGVPVVGDIELFVRERGARAPDAPFVAITGTNGKSTTTALIAHVLKEAGRDVAMGGNIGVPVLDLPPPAAGRTHVVECSSYQIDLAPSLAPSVGCLINITPDHLDRHGDLQRYAAIKERLVAHSDVALVGVDDEPCREILARLKARAGRPRVIAVSGKDTPLADFWVSEHRVMALGEAAPAADLQPARALRGAHNGQNAAFAYAAARTLGVERERIASAFVTFPGLAHRMEEVGRLGRVLFINELEGDQRRRGRKGFDVVSRYSLDPRGQAEGGWRRGAAALVPTRRQSLPDRRGRRRIRADARGRCSFRALRNARRSGRGGGRGRDAFGGPGTRGLAVAGLRVV